LVMPHTFLAYFSDRASLKPWFCYLCLPHTRDYSCDPMPGLFVDMGSYYLFAQAVLKLPSSWSLSFVAGIIARSQQACNLLGGRGKRGHGILSEVRPYISLFLFLLLIFLLLFMGCCF
jgi:hypothetical protein